MKKNILLISCLLSAASIAYASAPQGDKPADAAPAKSTPANTKSANEGTDSRGNDTETIKVAFPDGTTIISTGAITSFLRPRSLDWVRNYMKDNGTKDTFDEATHAEDSDYFGEVPTPKGYTSKTGNDPFGWGMTFKTFKKAK